MKQRGRKGIEALTVIGAAGIVATRRPDPPADLTAEQADAWREIVNAHPADWFTAGSRPVLAQMCRHITAARRVAGWLARLEADADDFDGDLWLRLLARQEAEGKAVAALATRLRLTPQSRYGPRAAHTAASRSPEGPKPWETGAADD